VLKKDKAQSNTAAAKPATTTSAEPDRFRIKCFRTNNKVSESIPLHLWFFFVEKATFLAPRPSALEGNVREETSLKVIANDAFMHVSLR
jgi:hypothetical protein